MPTLTNGTRAYEAAGAHRSLRMQEADVLRRATGALKSARDSGAIARAQAIVTGTPHRRFPIVSGLVPWPSNSAPPTYSRYAVTPTSSTDGSHHTLADDAVTPTMLMFGELGAVTSGPAPAVEPLVESAAPKRWTDGDPTVDTGATARSIAGEAAAAAITEPQSWSLKVL